MVANKKYRANVKFAKSELDYYKQVIYNFKKNTLLSKKKMRKHINFMKHEINIRKFFLMCDRHGWPIRWLEMSGEIEG